MRSVRNSKVGDGHKVIMMGTFDTKSEDFGYLYTCLTDCGMEVITINVGVFDSETSFPVNNTSEEVAQSAGSSLKELRIGNDRSLALEVMSSGAATIVNKVWNQDKVNGIISMGGGGGTYLALKVMRILPFGVPKICVSTLATKDLSDKIGSKDITLMPSIVDVAGLNSISKIVIGQAAGALSGMIKQQNSADVKGVKRIAISVFGNTTKCVDRCKALLKSYDFEVLTFHSIGTGGQTMETLIKDGYFEAVLDITTTELADELCGGICSAGIDRLTAASEMGIPQVVVPGCLDMVNFGSMESVPEKYKERQLYSWAPDVTLMRTSRKENRLLGKLISEKLNKSRAPVTILLPLGGLSKIGGKGEVFFNPPIDQELFRVIKNDASENIRVVDIEANIDTFEFADKAVNALLKLLGVTELNNGN